MKRKRTVKRPIFTFKHLLLLVISVAVFTVFYNQMTMRNNLIKQKNILEKEVMILEGETEALEKELSESDSLEFIEKVARDDYGMIKPGEIIYIDLNETKHLFGEQSPLK